MINSSLSPLGITWSVRIHNQPFNTLKIQKISVILEENKHDMAIVEVVGIPSAYLNGYVDQPIYIEMSTNGARSCKFYGNVSHIEGVSSTHEGTVDKSAFQLVKIVCLGTSGTLRGKNSRVWKNVSIKDIVSEIANKNRIGYSIPNEKYRFTSLVQKEQSSWQLLVNVANRLGYSISLRNNHIHIWNKQKNAGRQPSYSVLKGTKELLKDFTPFPGSIIAFNPTIGNYTPYGHNKKQKATYINNQGKMVTVSSDSFTKDPEFAKKTYNSITDNLAINATTYDLVEKVLKAQIKKNNSHKATATILGDPEIVPGGIVLVTGYDSNFDGYWDVVAVKHDLVSNSLLSYLTLEKDYDMANLPKFPKVQKYVKPPNPILINNTWVLAKEFKYVY